MRTIISFTIVSLFAVTAAAVPLQLTHQGRLLDSSAQPLTGSHQVSFRIWDAPTGSSSQWLETHNLAFDNGYYSVVLGDTNPIDENTLDENVLWLSLTIGGEELLPRQRIVSAPYAVMAGTAENATTVGGHGAADLRLAADLVDWSDLENVPADADTLAELPCIDGQVAQQTSSGWACANVGADTLAGLTCNPNDVATYTTSGWDCVPGASFDTRLTEGEVELFVTNEPLDLFDGSRVNGAAISVDGHGHDFDQITGTIHNSTFDAYANLSAYDRLNDDADTDLLIRAQADGRFVNESQADSISTAMIVDASIRGADLTTGAIGAITVSVSDTGADAYCPAAGTIKGDSSYSWPAGDDSACIQAAIEYAEVSGIQRVALLPGDPFQLTVPLALKFDIELIGLGGHAVQTALAPAAGFTGTELIIVDGDAGVWIHGLQFILDLPNVNGIGIADVRSFVIEDNLALVNSTAAFIRWEPAATFEGDKKVVRGNEMKSYAYLTTEVSGSFFSIDNVAGGAVFIVGLEILDNTYNAAQAGGSHVVAMVAINGNAPANAVTIAYANIHGNVFDTNSSSDCNEAMLTIDSDSRVRYSTVTNNRVAGAQLANLYGAITHSTFANNVARGRACEAVGDGGSDFAISAIDSYGLTILGNHTTDYDNEAYRLDHAYAAIVANNVDQNSNRFAYVLGASREISIKNNGFYSYCTAYGNTMFRAPVYVVSDCDRVAVRENVWRLVTTTCDTGDIEGVEWSGAAPANNSVFNQVWN